MKCTFKIHMLLQHWSQWEWGEKSRWRAPVGGHEISGGFRVTLVIRWSSPLLCLLLAVSCEWWHEGGWSHFPCLSQSITGHNCVIQQLPSRDKFEPVFDSNKSIPAANTTCWNSNFKKVQALKALDHKTLTETWKKRGILCSCVEPAKVTNKSSYTIL